jgi:hypothetical protein
MKRLCIGLILSLIFCNNVVSSNEGGIFIVKVQNTQIATEFINNQSDSTLISGVSVPDSIPLNATIVISELVETIDSVSIFIGTIDGISDVYESSFSLGNLPETISLKNVTGYTYIDIGEILNHSSFVAYITLFNNQGEPLKVLRYQRN